MSESSAPQPKLSWGSWIGQGVLYAAFAIVIAVFSHWPVYRHLAPDTALIKLSLVVAGKPVGDCRPLSAAELARLPPNMRAPMKCPRERSPVVVELDIDGQMAARSVALPSGLSRDGASAVYHRLAVPAGERLLQVRMRDDVRDTGFAHTLERRVTLKPAQVLVVDFDAEKGGIMLQ
ncbi:MAG: hypothetical protein KA387_07225 [Rubrivivax sp.]|nr:hypothetical protein [Rubrivivax sp.]